MFNLFRVVWPLGIATGVAFITAIYLAVIFIPSITSTILQLRSGCIQTLHNKDFNKYRVATDQISILTGSMFWGSLLSSALVGGFVGVIVFVFVWQVGSFFEEMSKLSPRSGQISSLTLLFDSL